MIVSISQRDVKIEVPPRLTKVGIKMGGGADSTILAYMIAKYKKEENPKIILVPIVIDIKNRNFQIPYTKRIINFIEKELDVTFEPMHVSKISTFKTRDYVESELTKFLYNNKTIDCHFMGATEIPPKKEFTGMFEDLPIGRHILEEKPEIEYINNNMISIRPFLNINKQEIKELYDHYNLTDILFPMTKSCTTDGQIDTPHCGYCWFCRERKWGFGKL
jgi:7-cyano-7-deazaguanine synthase in queuosine biosynthesis